MSEAPTRACNPLRFIPSPFELGAPGLRADPGVDGASLANPHGGAIRVSNVQMDGPDNSSDQRLTELEIKASFTEDMLDRLNDVVVRQQQQIEQLQRELLRLIAQVPAEGAPARSLRDELPPHY